MFEEYYQVLGIKKGSSKETIKRAFRRKALELHPDRNPGVDTNIRFLKVVEAYDILYNGQKPRPNNSEAQEEFEKAERLRKAKEKARESMREQREIERNFYRRVVNGYMMKYANIQAFVFMLFAVLVVFNYFMPYQKIETYIQSKNVIYYYHLGEERAFLNVCGSSYQARMQDFYNVKRGDPVSLQLSFLFKDVMNVKFETRKGKLAEVTPHESLYLFFPLIPLLMLTPFLNILYKRPTPRFYLLFFLNVFVGTAVLMYLLLDGGRIFRIFEGYSC